MHKPRIDFACRDRTIPALHLPLPCGGEVAGMAEQNPGSRELGRYLALMTATMLWCHYAYRGAPEQLLLAVMGGTSVRLFVVLAGSIGLFFAVESQARPGFLVWVVVFYLLTLTLEVVLVVRQQNAAC